MRLIILLFISSNKTKIYILFFIRILMGLEEKIGTVAVHGGNFHSDDVFAVAALKMIDPDLKVIRTRDVEQIKSADMRVDVGGEYCHENRSYDHHQKEGAGKRENGIPYASIGLVWKHYGAKICGSKVTADIVDEELIQKIDAVDTGHAKYDIKDPNTPYPLHYAINSFNPSWQEENPDHDKAFNEAVYFARAILSSKVREAEGKNLARKIVQEAIKGYNGEKYLVLRRFCPWEEAVAKTDANYVIFQNTEGNWMVSAVPKEPGVRGYHRKALPDKWAGLQSEELAKVTGVSDAVFCHKARFIAVAKSLEGAKQLAVLANSE